MAVADVGAALEAAGFALDGEPSRGATASVFLGRRVADDQPVALKVFDPDVDDARFEREAAILRQVDHAGVVQLLDFGSLPSGHRYLVETIAAGETLAQRLGDIGPFDVATTRRLLLQLADVLDHVHGLGIVHRDLALANVMVSSDDHVTLIDFGISRANDHPTVTAATDLVGTTRYMAPELIEGSEPSPASDQYAVAVILYELLAATWPFGDADTAASTMHHHLTSEPVPLRERVPHVPAELASAIEQALAKDPSQRFSSMRAMADAALGAADDHRSRRRIPVALAAVCAAVLVGLLTAAAIATRSADEPTREQPANANTALAGSAAAWPAGLAAQLACNLASTPGFEGNSLPTNFWLDTTDDDPDGIARLAPAAGVEGSAAIAIGRDNVFGAFGERFPSVATATYVLSADVSFSARPNEARAVIRWLDVDFQVIDVAEDVSVDLVTAAPGRFVLEVPVAPPGAVYVVPRLYKDASPGVLFVDELVFAERGSACDAVLGIDS